MNQPLNVLVAQQDLGDVDLILKALPKTGPLSFKIQYASGASEALSQLRCGNFDVVLLDLGPSGSPGLDALRAIARLAPRMPVVVLTDMNDEAAGLAAIREGAQDFLVKESMPEKTLARVLRLAVERRQAAETSKSSERLARAALDGISENIAILDEVGNILIVNRAWREFAETNGATINAVCEGANYLAVCDAAAGGASEGAREMAQVIRAVISGSQKSFTMEYPCHSPDQERWFVARVNLFSGNGPHRVVIAHENITERKKAEEQLRARERMYRAVVEDQIEVISRFREDGTFTFVNDVYCRFFAKPASELIGHKWHPAAVAEDLPYITSSLRSLTPSHPVVVIVNRVYSGTGKVHWMQFVNRAFFDDEGHLTEIQSVGRDITEQKLVEAELLRSRAELLAVYEYAPFMLCLLDENRRVVFANQSFLSYTGLPDKGCFSQVACGVLGCGGALDDPRGCGYGPNCKTCALRLAITDTIETGQSHNNIEYTTTKLQQGTSHKVTWLVSMARIPAESGIRVLLTLHDATDYRKAEAQLRASEARLRALYENSLVGILLTAPDGRVFNANPAACRILGRTEEDICRLGRFGLLDKEDPKLAPALAERVRTGAVQDKLTYIRGDGTRFPADTSSVIFDTAEGPRTCTIIQDVSERERAAERIREFSRRLLGIREEEKQRLSAALHHDVGSMSVGVGARLQAVEEELRIGKAREALAELRKCRQLFDESVQRLKTLAMEIRPPDLDILGLPATLRQHFAQAKKVTSLRITFTDATHGAKIDSDVETSLFRVAQECLNNVIKHAAARRVHVRLAMQRGHIHLSFVDNGMGFDPVLEGSRPGAGMGLRAVQEMLRVHGGELTIESAPGKGTKIKTVFPIGEKRT